MKVKALPRKKTRSKKSHKEKLKMILKMKLGILERRTVTGITQRTEAWGNGSAGGSVHHDDKSAIDNLYNKYYG